MTEQGQLSFALSGDRQHASALLPSIGHHELWTIDLVGKRRQSKVEFPGRPRMAVRTSSNSKVVHLHQVGDTIDLYEADGFKYLRTITLDGDMPYGTFHVAQPRLRSNEPFAVGTGARLDGGASISVPVVTARTPLDRRRSSCPLPRRQP